MLNEQSTHAAAGILGTFRLQGRIQGRWNGGIFTPFFWGPFFLFFFFFFFLSLKYWNNIWFLWHYYKNSPPISKSWIRPWIGLRVRDWVRVRLFNSSFQASHYHNTYPFHPMSYSLYLKPTWRTRALEMSLVWNSKIVLVLNLVLVVQSKAPYYWKQERHPYITIKGAKPIGNQSNEWMSIKFNWFLVQFCSIDYVENLSYCDLMWLNKSVLNPSLPPHLLT